MQLRKFIASVRVAIVLAAACSAFTPARVFCQHCATDPTEPAGLEIYGYWQKGTNISATLYEYSGSGSLLSISSYTNEGATTLSSHDAVARRWIVTQGDDEFWDNFKHEDTGFTHCTVHNYISPWGRKEPGGNPASCNTPVTNTVTARAPYAHAHLKEFPMKVWVQTSTSPIQVKVFDATKAMAKAHWNVEYANGGDYGISTLSSSGTETTSYNCYGYSIGQAYGTGFHTWINDPMYIYQSDFDEVLPATADWPPTTGDLISVTGHCIYITAMQDDNPAYDSNGFGPADELWKTKEKFRASRIYEIEYGGAGQRTFSDIFGGSWQIYRKKS